MNATPVSPADFIEDHVNGSDSDSNLSGDDDAPEYYEPISAVDDDDSDLHQNDGAAEFHSLPNGYPSAREAENGMSSLRLSDNKSSSEDEDEEEKEERMREEADSAVTRAFREDEDRRNAPLTAENAVRVMEAMRGVSFGGAFPDWAETDWIDQLRQLRQPPPRA